MRVLIALVIALCSLPPAAQAGGRLQGAELTAAFYGNRIDSVWERMSPQMQAALGSRDRLADFRNEIEAQLGAETAVIEETVDSEHGHSIYQRRARFEKAPMVILVQWAVDPQGRVAGFFVRPDQAPRQEAAGSEYLDHETRTTLGLPFDDEFLVFWGGRSVEQNYHAVDGNQRFALDLLVMRDGSSHVGDGRRNDDYHCFGKPILAPAAGTVVEAIDGIEDNVPGQTNPQQITGNRVIIDHGNDEYSVLAHLRNGSLHVAPGDAVAAGEQVGECGNSGNSSEPHLHYQLQNGPRFGEAAGLPAQFSAYVADGQRVSRGEPIKGQRIRPANQR